MALLGFADLTHSFGEPVLLDGVDLQIEDGERIGLLGRNGSGKSTLLRLVLGELQPNGGEVIRSRGLRVAGLEQEVPGDLQGTVAEQITAALAGTPQAGAWETEQRLSRVVTRLELDPEVQVADLSAGSKRRVLLARALVTEPDLLVLDEPTNHLDIDTIVGLEELLLRRAGALIFVTHDRMFLQRLATRILDLDRGALRSYACDYGTYLQRRDAELDAEAAEQANFNKLLAREEAWLRRGVKHRRRRNQGRVRALEALRAESRARHETVGRVRGKLQEAERSGQIVLRAEGLSHGFGGDHVLSGVETVIMRRDRIGIVGPNGCGKTTLLRRAKSLDTFCPLGPCLVTKDEIADPQNLSLRCTVNNEVRQDSNTNEMIFPVRELIEYTSRAFTLLPGDIITTGTPDGVGVFRSPPIFLTDGDEVVVEIEGIGQLSNRCEEVR